MAESTDTKPGLVRRGWGVIQWIIAAPLGLIALLALLSMNSELSAPGAPVVGYLISAGSLAIVALALAPPIFFRLPKLGKIGAYLGILVSFGFWATMLGPVQDAYARTPEGAKLAAERAAEEQDEKRQAEAERKADRERQETEEALSSTNATLAQLEELLEKQEECLSWGGELTNLNEMVRESLHNPEAFEHVSTDFIVPTAEGHNVAFDFRAENGFGAVRTARVLATMVPETCEIQKVTEPQEF